MPWVGTGGNVADMSVDVGEHVLWMRGSACVCVGWGRGRGGEGGEGVPLFARRCQADNPPNHNCSPPRRVPLQGLQWMLEPPKCAGYHGETAGPRPELLHRLGWYLWITVSDSSLTHLWGVRCMVVARSLYSRRLIIPSCPNPPPCVSSNPANNPGTHTTSTSTSDRWRRYLPLIQSHRKHIVHIVRHVCVLFRHVYAHTHVRPHFLILSPTVYSFTDRCLNGDRCALANAVPTHDGTN